MAGCLSVQGLNQFLQRGSVKNSRELRPIISNKADVIDNRIVDHPLSIRAMELVFDFDRIPLAANNPRVDFRRFSIRPVVVINYFFTSVRTEGAHIGVFDKVSEHRYKFFLLALQIIPQSPERFLRHCRKIKADQKDLPQRIPVSLNIFRASDGPENFDDAIHATLKLLLRGLGRSVWGKHQKEHRYNQREI